MTLTLQLINKLREKFSGAGKVPTGKTGWILTWDVLTSSVAVKSETGARVFKQKVGEVGPNLQDLIIVCVCVLFPFRQLIRPLAYVLYMDTSDY